MADLLVSLRELPVKLGESQSVRVRFVPGDDWQAGVMQVEAGTPVEIEVTLTSVDGGVLVRLQGECLLHGECVRCLEPIEKPVQIDVTEMFFESSQMGRPVGEQTNSFGVSEASGSKGRHSAGRLGSGEIEVEGDELDEPYVIERNQIDLEPLLRDEILVQSDYRPLCQPDCPGLCSHCGIKLAEAPQDHHHEFTNPSFAALADFFEKNKTD